MTKPFSQTLFHKGTVHTRTCIDTKRKEGRKSPDAARDPRKKGQPAREITSRRVSNYDDRRESSVVQITHYLGSRSPSFFVLRTFSRSVCNTRARALSIREKRGRKWKGRKQWVEFIAIPGMRISQRHGGGRVGKKTRDQAAKRRRDGERFERVKKWPARCLRALEGRRDRAN